MDRELIEKFAEALAISADRLQAILDKLNVQLVQKSKSYGFLQIPKEVVLKENVHQLASLGVSPKTLRNLLRVLEKYAYSSSIPGTLKDFKGKIIFSEVEKLRGVGDESIKEMIALLDHVGIKY